MCIVFIFIVVIFVLIVKFVEDIEAVGFVAAFEIIIVVLFVELEIVVVAIFVIVIAVDGEDFNGVIEFISVVVMLLVQLFLIIIIFIIIFEGFQCIFWHIMSYLYIHDRLLALEISILICQRILLLIENQNSVDN